MSFGATTYNISNWTAYIFGWVTLILASFGLIFILVTERHRNLQLLALTTCLILWQIPNTYNLFGKYGINFWFLFSILSHWTVAFIYMTAIIETRALTDRAVYFDNAAKLQQVQASKTWLYVATVVMILLGVADGVVDYCQKFVKSGDSYLYIGSVYGYNFLVIFSALVWGVALIQLLRHLKGQDKLLPKQGLFKLHGAILVAFIVTQFLYVLLDNVANNLPTVPQQRLFGVCSIIVALSTFFEDLSFWLVLFITLPITRQQRKRRMDFQTFLLNGFLDFDQLKEAVLAQNDFDDDERDIVLNDLDRFESFLERSRSSRGVVAEMTVIDPQFLAFQGNLVMKPKNRLSTGTMVSFTSSLN